MNFTKPLLALIILFSVNELISQNSQTLSYVDHGLYHYNYSNGDYLQDIDVQGTIYLTDNFVEGKIIDVEKKTTQLALLRYNAFDDVVEIKLNEAMEPRKLPKLENIIYEFPDYKLTYFHHSENGDDLEAGYYLEYFSKDELRLIAKPGLRMVDISEKRRNDKKVSLFVDYEYYILENGKLTKIKIRKKDLKKMFQENSEVVDYISKTKINEIWDVRNVLKYYQKK